jgi:fumarylacetoacetase
MPPLGPFGGKSFGTTISPWIVTRQALQPFLVSTSPKLDQAQGHLTDPENMTYAIKMQVEIQTTQGNSTLIGTSEVQSLYWTVRQMVAHATSSGSPLRSGDILATGTVSEPGREHRGCLLETTEGGQLPVKLNDGSVRTFLHDGDVVRMIAVGGEESSGVGFGECIGQVRASQLL